VIVRAECNTLGKRWLKVSSRPKRRDLFRNILKTRIFRLRSRWQMVLSGV